MSASWADTERGFASLYPSSLRGLKIGVHLNGLKNGDFERIDVVADIHPAGHFILVPTAVILRGQARGTKLEKHHSPLSFHHDYQGKLWRTQIAMLRKSAPDKCDWVAEQVRHVVADHSDENAKYLKEEDLLRTAGALSLLGLHLGAYLGKGYDCQKSEFRFARYPPYPCPVEIKKRSAGFSYQVTKYPNLPRAVVLCMHHDFVNLPDHVDVLELTTLAKHLGGGQ